MTTPLIIGYQDTSGRVYCTRDHDGVRATALTDAPYRQEQCSVCGLNLKAVALSDQATARERGAYERRTSKRRCSNEWDSCREVTDHPSGLCAVCRAGRTIDAALNGGALKPEASSRRDAIEFVVDAMDDVRRA